MSLGERLFSRILSAVRTLADPEAGARAARAFAPEPERRRLELLASAVAGRRVAVVATAGEGGVAAELLVFPEVLDALSSREANARLATLRAVIGGLMLREQMTYPLGRDDELPGQRELATFAALGRALAALREELPGAAALLPAMLDELRAARPSQSPNSSSRPMRSSTSVLEMVAHAVLGAEPNTLASAAPELAPAVLTEVLELASGAQRRDYPALRQACTSTRCPPIPLCGWLGASAPVPLGVDAATGAQAPRGGQERAGRAAAHIKRRSLRKQPTEENPLTHSFEKVHTLEKYQGGAKRIDGADELESHGEALDELELDEVVRSNTMTSSVYRAELPGVTGAEPSTSAGIAAPEALCYDEWDDSARRYRSAWCQVRVEHHPTRASPEATRRFEHQALARYRRERAELAEQLARLQLQPRRLGGQPDGPDIDVDAMVERHGALRHGTSGPEKLYVAQRRQPPELAVAFLLDRSLSSDSWVANQRVLDVGAEALVALGSALEPVAARTTVLAFASHTRRDCRLAMLKHFDEPWPSASSRLACLTPEGYTRIGPALRHVTTLLDREPARRKLLVLFSDGKPTDYDHYEGRYGLADVRQAVSEAGRAGVFVFAVALDRRARAHLPRMFGQGGFAVVTRPRELVAAAGLLVRQRLG